MWRSYCVSCLFEPNRRSTTEGRPEDRSRFVGLKAKLAMAALYSDGRSKIPWIDTVDLAEVCAFMFKGNDLTGFGLGDNVQIARKHQQGRANLGHGTGCIPTEHRHHRVARQ